MDFFDEEKIDSKVNDNQAFHADRYAARELRREVKIDMKLIQIQNIQLSKYKNIFKESSRSRLFNVLLIFLLVPGLLFLFDKAKIPRWVIIASTGSYGLFALCHFNVFVKTLSPFNWLLAIDNDGVLIKFRSYLNTHYPKYDKQVVSVPFNEISAIRINKGEMKYPNPRRLPTQEKTTYLDIITTIEDLQELKNLLKYEHNINIKGKSNYLHYPVSVVDDKIIRIEWKSRNSKIAPDISSAVAILSRQVNKETDIYKKEDFTNPEVLHRKDLEDKILELCREGNTITAVKIVMTAYNWNTTKAKEFVDKLSK